MKRKNITEKELENIPMPDENDNIQLDRLMTISYAAWNSIIILNGFLITIDSVFLSISNNPEYNFFLFVSFFFSCISCILIFVNFLDAKRTQSYLVSILNPNFEIKTNKLNKIARMSLRLNRNDILAISSLFLSFFLLLLSLYNMLDIRIPELFC